jgi:ribosomal protein S18 acetylase RimI-like enzyme
MEVRRALKSDFKDLVKIYNESRISVECFTDPDISIEEFTLIVKGEEIHLVAIESIIIGFISVWAKDNFIHHLYVTPGYQHRGVATNLLNSCVSCYGLPLSLKSVVSNTAACAFYENNKFVAESVHEDPDSPGEPDGSYHYYWRRNA